MPRGLKNLWPRPLPQKKMFRCVGEAGIFPVRRCGTSLFQVAGWEGPGTVALGIGLPPAPIPVHRTASHSGAAGGDRHELPHHVRGHHEPHHPRSTPRGHRLQRSDPDTLTRTLTACSPLPVGVVFEACNRCSCLTPSTSTWANYGAFLSYKGHKEALTYMRRQLPFASLHEGHCVWLGGMDPHATAGTAGK